MIVDAHTHIFEAGHGGPLNLPASADDLVRGMDEQSIDMAVVLPLPDVASNMFIQTQCQRFPDRLIGLYNPDFEDSPHTLSKMEQFFQDFQPAGLKIHPRLQRVRVLEPQVQEILAWAEQRRIPVLFDAFPYGPDLDDPGLHPLAFHRLAQDMPELKIVLAHAGGYKVTEAFLVAKSNPNVSVDISFTPVYFRNSSVAGDIAFLCSRLPAGRVLYGSDFPHVRLGESLHDAQDLTKSLSHPLTAALFGEAAATLFGMDRK